MWFGQENQYPISVLTIFFKAVLYSGEGLYDPGNNTGKVAEIRVTAQKSNLYARIFLLVNDLKIKKM